MYAFGQQYPEQAILLTKLVLDTCQLWGKLVLS